MFSQIWLSVSFIICTDKALRTVHYHIFFENGRNRPRASWLGTYLKQWMSDQTKLTPEVVVVESVKLKSALNQEKVTMLDGFRKSWIAQFKAESLISVAQQSEISIIKAEVDCSNPSFTESSAFPESPLGKIPDEEVKLLSKQNTQMTVIHF